MPSSTKHFTFDIGGRGRNDIIVRRLPSGVIVRQEAFKHPISCTAFSESERYLAVGWHESTESALTRRIGVALLGLQGKFRAFKPVDKNISFDKPIQLRFSPDEKTLWLASTDNLRAWDIATGRLKWQWSSQDIGRDSSLPYFSAISKDCTLYFRSDADGYTVWDTKTKKRLLRTHLPFLADADLIFSADASLATYYADSPVGIFNAVIDTRTGRTLWKLNDEQEITFMGDKALSRKDNRFEVHNARSGQLLYWLPTSPGSTLLPFESPDWIYSTNKKGELFRQRLR